VETEAPLDETFDIGVFTPQSGAAGFNPASVLYMQRQPINSGTQTVTVVADKLPPHAGVDPYNKRIDRNSDDAPAESDALPVSLDYLGCGVTTTSSDPLECERYTRPSVVTTPLRAPSFVGTEASSESPPLGSSTATVSFAALAAPT